MLTLISDTDCDMTPSLAKEFGYKVIIPMPYAIDGKLYHPYVESEDYDHKSFYAKLRTGTLPTTSAVSESVYIKYFEPEFADGNDILYVHFSSGMSNTFENMDKAVETLKKKYPERKFYSIDTLGISAESLNIAMEVGDMYKAGKTAEEIVEWSKTEVSKFPLYFIADDLKFFRRSGRVSGLAATMGNFIGIRPIIYVNEEGKMVSIGKEVGRNKAIDRLVQYVEELGEDVKSHRITIGHADCQDLVDIITAKLKEKFGDDLKIVVTMVNPTIGSHCGPNGMGVCFHGKHR
ncbi:MAG: DegV family protein [Bacteroidales bacterium]|nr:DegV family protein [Bacteroidales bacterium]